MYLTSPTLATGGLPHTLGLHSHVVLLGLVSPPGGGAGGRAGVEGREDATHRPGGRSFLFCVHPLGGTVRVAACVLSVHV